MCIKHVKNTNNNTKLQLTNFAFPSKSLHTISIGIYQHIYVHIYFLQVYICMHMNIHTYICRYKYISTIQGIYPVL